MSSDGSSLPFAGFPASSLRGRPRFLVPFLAAPAEVDLVAFHRMSAGRNSQNRNHIRRIDNACIHTPFAVALASLRGRPLLPFVGVAAATVVAAGFLTFVTLDAEAAEVPFAAAFAVVVAALLAAAGPLAVVALLFFAGAAAVGAGAAAAAACLLALILLNSFSLGPLLGRLAAAVSATSAGLLRALFAAGALLSPLALAAAAGCSEVEDLRFGGMFYFNFFIFLSFYVCFWG